jgi:uncharacterized membrane protein
LLAALFIAAGCAHLIHPEPFLAIMPQYLPWPRAIVLVSGAAEIAGGAGLLIALTRRAAACGLIVLLICVVPANVRALQTGMVVAGHSVPAWLLWMRLPVQPLLIAWVYFACLRRSRERSC